MTRKRSNRCLYKSTSESETSAMECVDDHPSCAKNVNSCEEDGWKAYMAENCKKTCGICASMEFELADLLETLLSEVDRDDNTDRGDDNRDRGDDNRDGGDDHPFFQTPFFGFGGDDSDDRDRGDDNRNRGDDNRDGGDDHPFFQTPFFGFG